MFYRHSITTNHHESSTSIDFRKFLVPYGISLTGSQCFHDNVIQAVTIFSGRSLKPSLNASPETTLVIFPCRLALKLSHNRSTLCTTSYSNLQSGFCKRSFSHSHLRLRKMVLSAFYVSFFRYCAPRGLSARHLAYRDWTMTSYNRVSLSD